MKAQIQNQTISLTSGEWSSVCFPEGSASPNKQLPAEGNQTVTNRNALKMTAPDGEQWLGLRCQIGISSSPVTRMMRMREPEPGTNRRTLCHPLELLNPSSKGIPEPVMNPSNPSPMGVPEPVMNPSAGMEKVREKAWEMGRNGITKGSCPVPCFLRQPVAESLPTDSRRSVPRRKHCRATVATMRLR